MIVYLNGQKTVLNRKNSLGRGGEAEVILHKGKAYKIYHNGNIEKEKSDKLRHFPKNLPDNVLSPNCVVTDQKGNIKGYVMDVFRGGEVFAMCSNKRYRKQVSNDVVINLFLQVYSTLEKLHKLGIIVGDLNDLNLLFHKDKIAFIDVDSMQFDDYPCLVATEQFLDPKLYGIDLSEQKPGKFVFTKETDYYAYSVMLFRSLLFVSPYGGYYKAYPTFKRRAEAGISVFTKDVKYPKAGLPYDTLPDDLLHEFYQTFEKGKRGAFPIDLIKDIHWKTCSKCGLTHTRNRCLCEKADYKPVSLRTVIVNRSCKASIIFRTFGKILFTKQERENDSLKFVYQENSVLKRENGASVVEGQSYSGFEFDIMGDSTLIAKQGHILLIKDGKVIEDTKSEVVDNRTVFSSNTVNYFRVVEGVLMKRDIILANVLENQTYVKTGERFGFGFYRFGLNTKYFIFHTGGKGLMNINLPPIEGKIVETECQFSNTHLLLLLSTVEKGKAFNSMLLISCEGEMLAYNKEETLNSQILATIQGKALLGSNVLTTTDEGLLLLGHTGSKLEGVKLFKDTEPFVNTECQIFPASDGVYVVSSQDIKLLKLN